MLASAELLRKEQELEHPQNVLTQLISPSKHHFRYLQKA